MSLVTASVTRSHFTAMKRGLARLGTVLIAVAIVMWAAAALGYLLSGFNLLPTAAARNPFATGMPGIVPMTSGLGALVLTIQAHFYAALTAAVQLMKSGDSGSVALATIGFLYGIFHAVGPGHGKGVISGYIVATNGSIKHGLVLCLASALLQAVIAIAVVGVFAVMLKSSASSINSAARAVELASFAAVAMIGAILLWTKSGELVNAGLDEARDDGYAGVAAHAQAVRRRSDWRILSGVILAAGIRPCSGAIILLVFSLSQDLFLAGVLGALAMAVGTSITTATLATMTVFAKSAVQSLTRGRARAGHLAFAGFELMAAAFVFVLGGVLFTGTWFGGILAAFD